MLSSLIFNKSLPKDLDNIVKSIYLDFLFSEEQILHNWKMLYELYPNHEAFNIDEKLIDINNFSYEPIELLKLIKYKNRPRVRRFAEILFRFTEHPEHINILFREFGCKTFKERRKHIIKKHISYLFAMFVSGFLSGYFYPIKNKIIDVLIGIIISLLGYFLFGLKGSDWHDFWNR